MSDKSCGCTVVNSEPGAPRSFLAIYSTRATPLDGPDFLHEYHLSWPLALNDGTELIFASS